MTRDIVRIFALIDCEIGGQGDFHALTSYTCHLIIKFFNFISFVFTDLCCNGISFSVYRLRVCEFVFVCVVCWCAYTCVCACMYIHVCLYVSMCVCVGEILFFHSSFIHYPSSSLEPVLSFICAIQFSEFYLVSHSLKCAAVLSHRFILLTSF